MNNRKTSCDSCSNYSYDDDYECYECQVDIDEDDMGRLSYDSRYSCPYYQVDDEYKIVRKQI